MPASPSPRRGEPTPPAGPAGSDARPRPDGIHIEAVDGGPHHAVALRVSGELDAVSAPLLGRYLDGLDLADDQVILLDLGDVSFVDSSGLRELVAPTRGVVRVSAASDVVRRVLEITGLEGMMSPPPS